MKKTKRANSRKNVEESSVKHINLNSNNSNGSFLSESSNTLNEYLIELKEATSNVPQKTWSQATSI